jgi:hypothetical protein
MATLGTPWVSNSPLLTGVTTFNGGSNSARIDGTVNAAATRVADWSDHTPLLATRTFASGATEVALNFYPPSSDQYGTLWVAGTDGGRMLANAFSLAAGVQAADETIPEPSTYLVTAAGLGLVGVMLRRRRTLQSDSAQRPRNL